MMLRLFICSLLLAARLAPAAELNWPEFRGPTGQGISQAVGLPVEWSSTRNVAWKVPVPGRGWSSPVVAGGRVYLTSAQEADGATSLHALCFEAESGRLLWDTKVFDPEPGDVAAIHRKNSPASPTPIVDGKRLYVHFGHMGTAALDLEGSVIWRQNSLRYTPVHGTGGSPALLDGALFYSADGGEAPFVASLDAATGNVHWKIPRNTPATRTFSFATPLAITVGAAKQIILPGSGLVAAYDPADGREIWRVAYGEGYSVVPRPVFAHGLLYVASGYDRAILHAIRPEGAAGDSTATHLAWTIAKGAPLTPSPLVVGDELYFVSDAGIATCADARTGQIHWTERLGGNFSASPFAAEGRLYFQNEQGLGVVVRAANTFEVLARNDLGEQTLASPAPVNGALFLRSENHLWKLRADPK